jgi:regulator of protease activity HflC (stomatin/prohibitin superfamily)
MLLFFPPVIAFLALTLHYGSYIVQEGNVGVVYYLGSLCTVVHEPGLHFVVPYLSTVHQVQTSVQTDHVSKIICGTSSGVSVTFESIEVVNQLNKSHVYQIIKDYGVNYDKTVIYDKITHELNQFCSKHTLQEVYIDKFDTLDDMLQDLLQDSLNIYGKGITIRNVRISKPSIPADVAKRYEDIVASEARKRTDHAQGQENLAKIEIENTKKQRQMQAESEQSLMQIGIENAKKQRQMQADSQQHLMNIEFEKAKELAQLNRTMLVNQMIIQKDKELEFGLQEVVKIKAETNSLKKKSEIDVEHYANMKKVEFNNGLQTDAYVKIKVSEHLANNSKVYAGFGFPDLSNIFTKFKI